MTQRVIPGDFPREQTASLPGAMPKVSLRSIDGKYYAGLTDEELWVRYDACEDLAQQLVGYIVRKTSEHGWELDDALTRVENSVADKVKAGTWDVSPNEILWMMQRIRKSLSNPTSSG